MQKSTKEHDEDIFEKLPKDVQDVLIRAFLEVLEDEILLLDDDNKDEKTDTNVKQLSI